MRRTKNSVQRSSARLRAPGVTEVRREDTEVWWVTGDPSGQDLASRVVQVIDDRAEQLREHYESL